ncbi:MAG: leucyl-tRNA synthetase [Bradymonadia bacterium]|jgi:leucyl-tRNA synthetase
MTEYSPKSIEPKWQAYWEANDTFRTGTDKSKPKYYALDMFPYPSGAGLHVGHVLGYSASDIVSRMKRMQGFNVLHPIGWDAFGLPAERAAVRENEHPATLSTRYISNFKGQLKRLGLSYDWDRELRTTDPAYYKWTQWIFLQLYKRGLAYEADTPVNWCPAQGTVLANEEVKDGLYVETGDPVYRKNLRQWQLRIPQYAERLLADLDDLDWSDSLKEMQRNWIGRSEGATVRFAVHASDEEIQIYTTRPDTLFGATYMVLAPEHILVDAMTTPENRDAVTAYVEAASRKSDLERTDLADGKTGVFTGAHAINPVSGEEIPIWISDYVLVSYGTGAIMAVPAHDDRDWEFAKTFGLPIIPVISGGDEEAAHTGDGVLINSGLLDGLDVASAKDRIIAWLEERELGKQTVNYRLRDWLFSRQRYWGEPFPLLHSSTGEVVLVDEADLPVTLPHLDEFKPTEDGQPPLARATDWLEVVDEATGETYLRETNTMPQWAGSCWYYLRYIDPHNEEALVGKAEESYWMPVDLYIGGAEHAVLHLLYARFWHKVLYDIGAVSTKEPFQRLFNQGMITAHSFTDEAGKYYYGADVEKRDGGLFSRSGDPISTQVEKMGKSKNNSENPDDVIEEFGADSLRLYEMYMGPLDASKPWQTQSVKGMHRFLSRVYRLVVGEEGLSARLVDRPEMPNEARASAIVTKKVSEDVPGLRMNTALATLIEWVNGLYKADDVPIATAKRLVLLLSPFAPHLGEELWEALGESGSTSAAAWPSYDEAMLVESTLTLPVQINGKTRGMLEIPADASQDEIVAAAKALDRVAAQLDGKTIVKTIVVPGKIINFIAK